MITTFSCSEEKKKDSIDVNAITKEVTEVFDDYVNQVNSKGINGVDFYFSKDSRFYWIEDGIKQYPNRDSLLNAIEAFYPTVKTINLKASKVDVEVLDSNTVMLYVEYVEDISLNAGYAFTLDGAMTILTVKEDSSWKFLIGHSSIKKPRGNY
ncbi:MAG: hypothetical protein COW40_18280 [Cytophagales bacterium CG17_big_fil_post_rev_8_21_14_2_50_40_13]|nr:MAG: hypothetical protein COW40_18280 [Cytophagales bacterium CG17_big_fil_post_rev_8_21_14_2_50_40_13]